MAIPFNLANQSRQASPPTAPTINTLVFGRGSHLKFAEQVTSGTAIIDPDHFSRYKVAINSMAVAPTTNLLTPGVIPVTVEQFKGVPGPLTIDGNFVLDALPRRQELFFRQLLNAPTASINDITGASLLSATSLAVASDSLDTPPSEPSNLTVTLSGTVTRGGNAISATNEIVITITGTDENDGALTETLRFSNPNVLTQTTVNKFKTVSNDGVATNHAASPASSVLAGMIAITQGYNGVSLESSTDYRLTPGLTVEAVMGSQDSNGLGGVPNTIVDAYLNTFSFNATREEIVTYNFGLTGKEFNQNVNPAASAIAFVDTARHDVNAGGPYGPGNFATIQDDQTPYAGYNGSLRVTYPGTTEKANFEGVLGLTSKF